jgi:hypothetical protein
MATVPEANAELSREHAMELAEYWYNKLGEYRHV